MLEFLFDFIVKNIFLIFISVLVLGIASTYSRKIKLIFITSLGLAAFHFMLLCLFRLGIGLEWSSKYIYLVCVFLEQYLFVFMNNETIFMRIWKLIMVHGFEDSILQVVCLLITIISMHLVINVFFPLVRRIIVNKLFIKNEILIKIKKIINTIREKQPKFLVNLVVRC